MSSNTTEKNSSSVHPHLSLLRWKERVRTPGVTTDALQIVKIVVAASFAWWLSVFVLDSTMPFLAPWVALLTVYPTVFQSVTRGAQMTIASWVGVGVSFLIGNYLGVGLATFALAILIGMLISRLPWLREEGVAVATTAIFVLGDNFSEQQFALLERGIEVGIGAAVGLLINVLLFPPLRDQQAARYVEHIHQRIGNVLIDISNAIETSWNTDEAESWRKEIESIGDDLDEAWGSVVSAQQSRRMNPRPQMRLLLRREDRTDGPNFESALAHADEGVSHLRHLARTLREATYAAGEWDTRFRREWSHLLEDAGRVIADPDCDVEPIDDRLVRLSERMAEDGAFPSQTWPLYGSLISSMRHIVRTVTDATDQTDDSPPRSAEPAQ